MRIIWSPARGSTGLPPRACLRFTSFFRTHLLPIQQRHGARLVGRWQTDDDLVVEIWERDGHGAYCRTQAAVRSDPAIAQQHRQSLPLLFTSKDEVLMTSTITRATTGSARIHITITAGVLARTPTVGHSGNYDIDVDEGGPSTRNKRVVF